MTQTTTPVGTSASARDTQDPLVSIYWVGGCVLYLRNREPCQQTFSIDTHAGGREGGGTVDTGYAYTRNLGEETLTDTLSAETRGIL